MRYEVSHGENPTVTAVSNADSSGCRRAFNNSSVLSHLELGRGSFYGQSYLIMTFGQRADLHSFISTAAAVAFTIVCISSSPLDLSLLILVCATRLFQALFHLW